MDLQTMNIHYPKGKLKKINMPKIGHYPVAVVPGQFTDYYRVCNYDFFELLHIQT